MPICEICRDYKYDSDPCKKSDPCKPIYTVEMYGDSLDLHGEHDWKVGAYDHEEAARKFAEHYDLEGDHSLMTQAESVIVTGPKGDREYFQISAEPRIHYSANQFQPKS